MTARYYGSSTTTNSLNGADVRTTGYWAPEVGVQTQVRFTPVLSANAGFRYIFVGNPTVTNEATGDQHLNQTGNQQVVNVSLNYHFIPNRLVGSVNYGHTFYGDSRAIYPADPAFDDLEHRTQDLVGASLRYLF